MFGSVFSDADFIGFINEAEFTAKLLASSLSSAVVDSSKGGNKCWWECNIVFDILDFCHDCKISATASSFDLPDTERDGELTRTNYMIGFDMFDANLDGCITGPSST